MAGCYSKPSPKASGDTHVKVVLLSAYSSVVAPRSNEVATGCLIARFSRNAARLWLPKGNGHNNANGATMLMDTTIRRLNTLQGLTMKRAASSPSCNEQEATAIISVNLDLLASIL